MLRLRTFGGLWIEGTRGTVAPSPPPRRLALLAALASAGPRGLSRERLLGILWPDGDEERGRHSLAQTVYSLRRDLGSDAAIVGTNELRLDPAVLPSDVAEFREALTNGDPESVARLYNSPFLDGFYLTDAPEFERWVEDERARYAKSAEGALEKLARLRENAGLVEEAAALWQRLTVMQPMSARYATAYMRALAKCGDRAGALAHARDHEAAVLRDLETPPDPEVTRLAGQVRAELAREPEATTPNASPALPLEAVSLPPSISTVAAPRRGLLALVTTGVLALLAIVAWRALTPGAHRDPPLLAVGVLRDVATHDSANSGGVLTDMLATSLARIPGLQVVANSRLVELIPRGSDTTAAALPEAARRAGAKELLEGEFTFAPDGGLRLELRRIDLGSGVLRHGYEVHAFDRYAAVDSATVAIAADFGLSRPSRTIAEVSTASPIAYRFYEEGLRAFFQYDAAAALRLMQSALEEDSSFAMAAFYAWRSELQVDVANSDPLLLKAVTLAPRAADRERLLILGMTRASQEDPSALAPAESLTIRFPTDPDGQALLGKVRMARGEFPQAIAAFRRAVALDSAGSAPPNAVCRACESLQQIVWAYFSADSLPAAERAVQAWMRFRPSTPEPSETLAELRWRQERWNDADAALARADSLGTRKENWDPVRFRAMIRRGNYDELAREAAVALRDPDRARRDEARWLWLTALRNQGRLHEALALLRAGQVPGDGTVPLSAFQPDRVSGAILDFETGDLSDAVKEFRTEADNAGTILVAGHRARGVAWNLTHVAVAYASAGDTTAMRRLADSIEVIGPKSLFGRGSRLHYFVRGLLLARAGRHADAVEAYRRAVFTWTEGYTRINYELARSLVALGRPVDALYPLQAALRGGIDGSNLYITRTELHELLAQAFGAAGRRDSASTHYREVVRAWSRADPRFQPRRQAAILWLATSAHGDDGAPVP